MSNLCIRKNFIAFDTAYEHGLVLLGQNNKILHQVCLRNQLSHGTQICGAIHECCEKANKLKIKLDFLAVGLGPGSFVGLRVGLATGLGFSFGKKIPIIGFCTHQALANNFLSENKQVCVIMKASRGFYYLSLFSPTKKHLAPEVISFAEIKNKINKKYFVVSNCALIKEIAELNLCEITLGSEAEGILQAVYNKINKLGVIDESDFILPNYVKLPNARPQKISKLGA